MYLKGKVCSSLSEQKRISTDLLRLLSASLQPQTLLSQHFIAVAEVFVQAQIAGMN